MFPAAWHRYIKQGKIRRSLATRELHRCSGGADERGKGSRATNRLPQGCSRLRNDGRHQID